MSVIVVCSSVLFCSSGTSLAPSSSKGSLFRLDLVMIRLGAGVLRGVNVVGNDGSVAEVVCSGSNRLGTLSSLSATLLD